MTTPLPRTERTTICGTCHHRTTRHVHEEGRCTAVPVHPITLVPQPCHCRAVTANEWQEISEEEARARIMAYAATRA